MPSRFFGGMVGGDTGGGSSITFPIHLVAGDNGQVGIDLYNYLLENHQDGDYYFTADEVVTVHNVGNIVNNAMSTDTSHHFNLKFKQGTVDDILECSLYPNGHVYILFD